LACPGIAATDELILDTSGRTISMPESIGNVVRVVVRGMIGQCESLDLYYERSNLQTTLDEIRVLPTGTPQKPEEHHQPIVTADSICSDNKEIQIAEKPIRVAIGKEKALNYFLVKTRKESSVVPTTPDRSDLDKAIANAADKSKEVKVLTDEIKAYAGMSSEAAAASIKALIEKLDP